MPLTNCRPIRSSVEFERARSWIPAELLTMTGGNLAYMVLQAPDDFDEDAFRPQVVRDPEVRIAAVAGTWVIGARNRTNEEHSEVLCIRCFSLSSFRRQGVRVSMVFTEREPCHGGAYNCKASLEEFLGRYGNQGTATKVRYLADYLNAPELRTSAELDNVTVGQKRARNRQEGRDAAKRFRGDE